MPTTSTPSWPPLMPQPPKLPKYVERTSAKGRTYYYFRIGGRRVHRFAADPHTPAFFVEYAERLAAFATAAPPLPTKHKPGSVRALIADYQASPEFRAMTAKTRRDYARQLQALDPIGGFRAADVRRAHVIKLRNAIAASRGERTANLFVAVVGALFRCGLDLDYGLEINPAHQIRKLGQSTPHKVWPTAARSAFEDSDPPRWMMTAYMLGLWTGLRLGEVLCLSRTAYDGQGFDVGRSKRGIDGYVPAAGVLRAYLDACPIDGLLFVVDERGRRITVSRATHAFRLHLDALGFPALSFHGLRHTAGQALAEAGASEHMIQAITGHRTLAMVSHYTRTANQRRLARAAIDHLDRSGGTAKERQTAKPSKPDCQTAKRDKP